MRDLLTRRKMIQGVLGVAAAGAIAHKGDLFAQVGRNGRPTGQEMGEMNRIEFAFRKQYSVPASSIAISRNGQFVYDIAHGMADKQGAQQVQQSSLFRIASATKPVTSVTIFSLIEQGKLNLNDKVFGPSGVLGTKYGNGRYKQYVTDVTVDHLLSTGMCWAALTNTRTQPSNEIDASLDQTMWNMVRSVPEWSA